MKRMDCENYSVLFDTEVHKFSIHYKKTPVITDAYVEGLYHNGKKIKDITDFKSTQVNHLEYEDYSKKFLDIEYKDNEADDNIAFKLRFSLTEDGVSIKAQKYDIKIAGKISTPCESIDDVFPVCIDRNVNDLRSAIGKASSNIDNATYNKKTDMAVIVGNSRKTKISFNRENNAYNFTMPVLATDRCESNTVSVQENVLVNKYHIKFSPYNRNSTFKTPPIGWMTWYAVKFDACEEIVLKNAKWQAENLKDYGANTVWVDWEWYHEDFNGDRTDGVNSLMPDPKKYPNGMKYLADKIKEMGLIPAIWIGYTNEPCKNKYIEKYPEMVLVDEKTWCGRYYYDFSNPHYLNEYLPEAVENVHKWGYEAVKYDTIPISVSRHQKNHDKMYDPSLTVKEALYNMIKKTRELLGENVYMLSCSGSANSSILWASDIFDAARIGDDIFTWQEHIKNIGRIEEFYPLHNIQFHADADNVVLRDEFNNFEQAKSRATIISLLGLPMTFGDQFEVLSNDRVDVLKRSLPILDIHPMDLSAANFNEENLLINLNIEKDYESYLVTGVYNLTDKDTLRTLDLAEDLHLDKGTYLIYDYFRNKFIGKTDASSIALDLVPYEGRILSIRPYTGKVQLISTSRHITQGAAEITDMRFCDDTLYLTADLIAKDSYTVTLYVPDGFELDSYTGFTSHTQEDNLLKLTYLPDNTGEYKFCVNFKNI